MSYIHIYRPQPIEERFFEDSTDYFKNWDVYGLVETQCCGKRRWLKDTSVKVSLFEWYDPSYSFRCHKCKPKEKFHGKLIY